MEYMCTNLGRVASPASPVSQSSWLTSTSCDGGGGYSDAVLHCIDVSTCLVVAVVHDVVTRGGRCLIPVFALGRAQELLLILGKFPCMLPHCLDVC